MNLADDAVPMLGRAGFALSIGVHCHNVDVEANANKYLHPHVSRCGLVAVHFYQQVPEMALRSRIRSLRVFAESQELAEPSGVRAAVIVLGFENKARNPFLPLPCPGVCRLSAASDILPRVEQREWFAERYPGLLGLLAHFKPAAFVCELGHWWSRKNPRFTPLLTSTRLMMTNPASRSSEIRAEY
jgi:hypothetical protein